MGVKYFGIILIDHSSPKKVDFKFLANWFISRFKVIAIIYNFRLLNIIRIVIWIYYLFLFIPKNETYLIKLGIYNFSAFNGNEQDDRHQIIFSKFRKVNKYYNLFFLL